MSTQGNANNSWTFGPGGYIHAPSITVSGPAPTPLFGNWLEKTKELQESAYGHKFDEWSIKELADWVIINSYAAEDEIHEASAEISWKPWASAEFFNRDAYIGELVDVMHFVANMLVGAQVTDAEFNAAYLEKMERNRKRQRDGYTGIDKCNGCKRAKDDIIAHGGTWDGIYCGECSE